MIWSERGHFALIRHGLALLLTAALLLVLSACGSAEPDPNAGIYQCVWIEKDSVIMDPEELFPGGITLELGQSGRGLIRMEEKSGTVSWSRTEDVFLLTVNGMLSKGTLRDGVIDLELNDSGVILTLVREGTEVPNRAPAQELLEAQAAFEGDWYGYWRVTDSEGNLPDSWYDCFATVEHRSDRISDLSLWDERTSREEPLAMVPLRFDRVKGSDCAFATGGFFWFQELSPDEWEWKLEKKPVEIRFEGEHDAEGEHFRYEVVLRPWGADWEDCEPDERPYYYEDWYQSVKDGRMPDELGPVESILP